MSAKLANEIRVFIGILQYGLWTLAVVLQTAVGVLMLRQRLHRQFPVFFCYTVFQVFRSVALFSIIRLKAHLAGVYAMYFDFYWITDAICIALSLLLIYEVSRSFFRDYPLARAIVSAALMTGTLALLVFDVFLTASMPGHESHRLLSLILLLDRNLAVIQGGLVLVLFLCAQLMALPWRTNLSFGISMGLGILELADVVTVSARSRFGRVANDYCATGTMFAYVLAVVVWVVYISLLQQTSKVCVDLAPASANVEEWNRAITDLLKR